MAWILLACAILVGVRVVFQLLAVGWARPWAERYLKATAPRESGASVRDDDHLRLDAQPILGIETDFYKNLKERMDMDRYDPTGAGMYRGPKWVCWTEGQVSGNKGHNWNSRQSTMEAARREAAEIFGVPVEDVKVDAFNNAMPASDADWIDPLAD